jgi:hypothetical protein
MTGRFQGSNLERKRREQDIHPSPDSRKTRRRGLPAGSSAQRELHCGIEWERVRTGEDGKWTGTQLRIVSVPGGRWFWTNFKNEFEEDFRKVVDGLLDESS